MDSDRTAATALQVRNFKTLLEAAGSIDDLALTLDMSLQRVSQLLRGEDFFRETVHHIEETLQLPSGFMDRLDARVMPDLFNGLKESLSLESGDGDVARAPVWTSPHTHTTSLPGAEPNTSPSTSITAETTLSDADVEPRTPDTQGTAPPHTTPSFAETGIALLVPSRVQRDVLEIRRLNLAMLTEAPGAKRKLAHIMDMSPANISHRIHKNKKLDDAEIRRFTKILGLSPAWFDTPRLTGDIPDGTKTMLAPEPRRSRNGRKAMHDVVSGSGADALPRQPMELSGRLKSPLVEPTAAGTVAVAVSGAAELQTQLGAASENAGTRKTREATFQPSGRATALAAREQVAVTATASTVFLSLGDDDGMGPIARALLHTVFLKARAGDLDEAAALRLLQEVAALEPSSNSEPLQHPVDRLPDSEGVGDQLRLPG